MQKLLHHYLQNQLKDLRWFCVELLVVLIFHNRFCYFLRWLSLLGSILASICAFHITSPCHSLRVWLLLFRLSLDRFINGCQILPLLQIGSIFLFRRLIYVILNRARAFFWVIGNCLIVVWRFWTLWKLWYSFYYRLYNRLYHRLYYWLLSWFFSRLLSRFFSRFLYSFFSLFGQIEHWHVVIRAKCCIPVIKELVSTFSSRHIFRFRLGRRCLHYHVLFFSNWIRYWRYISWQLDWLLARFTFGRLLDRLIAWFTFRSILCSGFRWNRHVIIRAKCSIKLIEKVIFLFILFASKRVFVWRVRLCILNFDLDILTFHLNWC